MGKLFSGLSSQGLEEAEDRLGGGRRIFDTDVYENIDIKLKIFKDLDAFCPAHTVLASNTSSISITKIGSAQLRRGLFMPAMSARIFNPLLKTFAERLLANGKKPKQVIVAIMRKLLHQIHGILKSGQPYNPEKRGCGHA